MSLKEFKIELFTKSENNSDLRLISNDSLISSSKHNSEILDQLLELVEVHYPEEKDQFATIGNKIFELLAHETNLLAKLHEISHNSLIRFCGAEEFRYVPWLLLKEKENYLCQDKARLLLPVIEVNKIPSHEHSLQNRSLSLLFMACSPKDTIPLDFENEERLILASTEQQPIKIAWEESGSLSGLQTTISSYQEDYFDILHLTGHGTIDDDGEPCLVMESDTGEEEYVRAENFSSAFNSRFPRLVFLSTCHSSEAFEKGFLPSFSERLINLGATAVIGWAAPVYEDDAAFISAEVYKNLAIGLSLSESLVRAMHKAYEELGEDSEWHLLRVCVNRSKLGPFVTPLEAANRITTQFFQDASTEFLDEGAKTEVCPRSKFIGRRRPIQKAVKALRSLKTQSNFHEGVLIQGIGGIGKSSLAARICDVLGENFKRHIVVGKVDELEIFKSINKKIEDENLFNIINGTKLPFYNKIFKFLNSSTEKYLFIFDDFEENIVDGVLDSTVKDLVESLLKAIRASNSRSKVIVTSRFDFNLSKPINIHKEHLGILNETELNKKIHFLPNLTELRQYDPETFSNVVKTSDGIPRLLERFEVIVSIDSLDIAKILDQVSKAEQSYRDEILIAHLYSLLSDDASKLLNIFSIMEIPIDVVLARQISDTESLETNLVDQIIKFSLLEFREEKEQYYVPKLIRNHCGQFIEADNEKRISKVIADYLYKTYWKNKTADFDTGFEIHRLAIKSESEELINEVTPDLAFTLMLTHRYIEAEKICLEALALYPNSRVKHALARAQGILGNVDSSRKIFEELEKDESLIKDADFLNNYAIFLARLNDYPKSIEYYKRAIKAYKKNGDKLLELRCISNLTMLLKSNPVVFDGEINRLCNEILRVKSTDKDIIDVKAAALLTLSSRYFTGKILCETAIKYCMDASLIFSENFNLIGVVNCMGQMSNIYYSEGELELALAFVEKALEIVDELHDPVLTLNFEILRIGYQSELDESSVSSHEFIEIINKCERLKYWDGMLSLLSYFIAWEQSDETKLLLKAQWLWLGVRVSGHYTDIYNMVSELFNQLPKQTPLKDSIVGLCALYAFIPNLEETVKIQIIMNNTIMLASILEKNMVQAHDINKWFSQKNLGNAGAVFQSLSKSIAEFVGSQWLFNKDDVPDTGWFPLMFSSK